jgi:hypothetical protein
VRPEHHLRPFVTCHDAAHHGESAGLSQNVRLSATRRGQEVDLLGVLTMR